MKVVVTGATGNCGTALVRDLVASGHDVRGIARRAPDESGVPTSVQWYEADVATSDLDEALKGADAVVHLAWMFQPTRRPETTWRANAVGTQRVLEAVSRGDVPAVVVASSVAAYSPTHHDEPVDESWPTNGPSTASYALEKAYVERCLDAFELAHPAVRVVRMRPAFVFQRSAGTEQRRIFGRPTVRPWMFDRRLLPLLPIPRGLRFQTVHTSDLARAYVAAVERPVRGAFNVAAEEVVRRHDLGHLLDAGTLEVPPRLLRTALSAAWHARAIPAPPELYDAFLRIPVMSTARAKAELDWLPQHSALDALAAMIDGARRDVRGATPPLA